MGWLRFWLVFGGALAGTLIGLIGLAGRDVHDHIEERASTMEGR